MNSGDVQKNLFAVWASICELLGTGKRKLEDVLRWLQVIVSREDFVSILDTPRSASVDTTPADWRAEMERFYQEVLCLKVDFSSVEIGDDPGGFGWVMIVAQGLTLNQVWAKCRDRFPCSSDYGDDLDTKVPKNDRTSKTAYAKRLRNRVEADEELKNLSANDLTKQKIQGITLLERLLLELWYHWKTGGGHLDLLNWTLCSGSWGRGGCVPGVGWGASAGSRSTGATSAVPMAASGLAPQFPLSPSLFYPSFFHSVGVQIFVRPYRHAVGLHGFQFCGGIYYDRRIK